MTKFLNLALAATTTAAAMALVACNTPALMVLALGALAGTFYFLDKAAR